MTDLDEVIQEAIRSCPSPSCYYKAIAELAYSKGKEDTFARLRKQRQLWKSRKRAYARGCWDVLDFMTGPEGKFSHKESDRVWQWLKDREIERP